VSTVGDQRSGEHTVVFADTDAELIDVACDVLGRALSGGRTTVVIATPAHRDAFLGRLGAGGHDPEAARRGGTLILLDAAETLARLTPHGTFDRGAFDEVIGTLIRTAAYAGRVQAFGEMVALLWDEGRVEEAIELEAAWDDLVAETSVSLLCAYPGQLIDDPRDASGVETVCRLHSAVAADSALERTWHFPAEITAASRARRLLTTALQVRGVGGRTLADAQLVTAELVGNALRHVGGPFSFRVSIDGARVLLEVTDDSSDVPVVRALDVTATTGRGLHLIGALAQEWGVRTLRRGKLVWAEIRR
jgi:anti-sigma regulatory factor (Ser/Thr protein kinase)